MNRFILAILTIGIVVSFTSCEKEFDAPPGTFCVDPENLDGDIITIAELKARYASSWPNPVFIEDDVMVVGIATSSDKEGNLYKTMYLQDETGGIAISLDATDTYNDYAPGTKVWIKCKNLYVGEFGGTGLIQIGGALNIDDPTSVDRIPETLVSEHLIAGTCGNAVDTLFVGVNEISVVLHQSMVVKLTDVQFSDDELGETYANAGGGGGQNRSLEDCDGAFVTVRNSDFASFAAEPIPAGKGSIVGIVGVFNNPQLILNDISQVKMEDPRCDGSGGGGNELINETFESASVGPLNLSGWISANEFGNTSWLIEEFSDNNFAEASAFSTGESSMIVWLVSPSIDFDGNTGEMLFCQVQEAWDNGATLDVMVSTDFDGTSDPWDATWTPFTDTRPWDSGQPGDTPTGFGNWESFQWDLSSFSGTGYIAFRYTGSDSGNQTTTYAIDDVRVIADE